MEKTVNETTVKDGIQAILSQMKPDSLYEDVAKEICAFLESKGYVVDGGMPKFRAIWIEVDGNSIKTDWTLNFTSPTEVMATLMVSIDSVKNNAFSQVNQQRPIQGRPPWVKRGAN